MPPQRPNSTIYCPSVSRGSSRPYARGRRCRVVVSCLLKSTCNFRMFSRRPSLLPLPYSPSLTPFVCFLPPFLSPFLSHKRFNGLTALSLSISLPVCFLCRFCKRYSRKIAGSYKVRRRARFSISVSRACVHGPLLSASPRCMSC